MLVKTATYASMAISALKYVVDKNVNNLFYIDFGEASYSIILAPKLRKINKPDEKKELKNERPFKQFYEQIFHF